MAVNKRTLRALVVLELIDTDEEKEEESNGRRKTGNWIKKGKNLDFMQTLCKNYNYKTQVSLRK